MTRITGVVIKKLVELYWSPACFETADDLCGHESTYCLMLGMEQFAVILQIKLWALQIHKVVWKSVV